MKLALRAGLILALVSAAAVSCGHKPHRPGPAHGSANAAPEPAPPTPDTTPIDALRTPAGLVLKIEAPTPSEQSRGSAEGGGDAAAAPTPSKPGVR